MYVFTTYIAAWLPDIQVESSTGTRDRVTVMYDVTWTSEAKLLTNRELTLGYFKATRYTAGTIVHSLIYLHIFRRNDWDIWSYRWSIK